MIDVVVVVVVENGPDCGDENGPDYGDETALTTERRMIFFKIILVLTEEQPLNLLTVVCCLEPTLYPHISCRLKLKSYI